MGKTPIKKPKNHCSLDGPRIRPPLARIRLTKARHKGNLMIQRARVRPETEPICRVLVTMKVKWVILAALLAFVVPAMISRSRAVNTDQIDAILTKQQLTSQDLQIIDDFLSQALEELLRTKDFTDVAKIRTVIVSKKSTQPQYAQQFSQSALKYISRSFEQAKLLPDDRQFKVNLNLLILIDSLIDTQLVDLAIARLPDNNEAIRYWAVRCVTNPGLVQQLNMAGPANAQLARRITQQLADLIDTSNPETLGLIAVFAARIDLSEGQDLLLQLSDMRAKRYADWTVKYELLDGAILKLLAGKMLTTGSSRPVPIINSATAPIARRFGQLYSHVMQRYMTGQAILRETQKHHLASVLVEIEDKCIQWLLEMPQSSIRRAVEQTDYSALQAEHSRLFGTQTTPGQLATKLQFDYASDPTGARRPTPLPLPAPPPPRTN